MSIFPRRVAHSLWRTKPYSPILQLKPLAVNARGLTVFRPLREDEKTVSISDKGKLVNKPTSEDGSKDAKSEGEIEAAPAEVITADLSLSQAEDTQMSK